MKTQQEIKIPYDQQICVFEVRTRTNVDRAEVSPSGPNMVVDTYDVPTIIPVLGIDRKMGRTAHETLWDNDKTR
jgi:hypothetical protein